jgi:integrase
MAAWCGLRFGELAALRKSRIDLDTETVMVAESVSVLAGGVRHVGPQSLTPAVGPWRSRHI